MGIQPEVAAFVKALRLPKGFSVCELGDQEMCGPEKHVSAKGWYAAMGCGRYESIDANGRGTRTADLNAMLDPLDPFDLVTDFGTGEHIFDQAQVWRSIHTLTKPGGFIAFDRPAQGYEKHCYYLVNRCLVDDIAAVNGYTVLLLEQAQTPRGALLRGVFKRPSTYDPFRIPQQGRYRKSLVIQ